MRIVPCEVAVEEYEEKFCAIWLVENGGASAAPKARPCRSDQDATRILETGEKGIYALIHFIKNYSAVTLSERV